MMMYFYTLGQQYPLLGKIAVFISGPLSYIVIPFSLLFYFSIKAKQNFMHNFALIFLSGLASYMIAHTIKEIGKIARPFVEHSDMVPLRFVSGYSFPSEHASVYGAITVLLFYFDYRLGILSVMFTCLIMISRLIMGVHYPVDVIFGVMLGGCIAFGIIIFFKKFLI